MRLSKCTALVCALLLTACSGIGSSSGKDQAAADLQQVDMQKVQASVTSAQTSITNAQTALSSIFTINGNSASFNWSIFLGGLNVSTLATSTQTCIQNAFPTQNVLTLVLTAPTDISTALSCVFNDVVTVATAANTDLSNAMSLLNSALAADPSNAAAIQAMIAEVQTAQTSFNTMMQELAGELTIVTTFLNQVPSMAQGLIPIPIANMLVGMTIETFIQPVITAITTFQTQLRAL